MFALGAAMGTCAAFRRECATGWEGTLIATVCSPAVARDDSCVVGESGSTRVRGPGQKAWARAMA